MSRAIHVVVVGLSTAGAAVARTIASLATSGVPSVRVTAIDRNPFYYHVLGTPRGLVDAAYASQQFFRLDNLLTEFEPEPARPQHRVVQASLVRVRANRQIELSTGESLAFDYLVLATGADNVFPANINAPTIDAGRELLASVRDEVSRAQRILIIGGGPVGVEVAGEVAAKYPNKSVTLVHSGSHLLPPGFKKGLSEGAVDKLRRLGVEVVFGERVTVPAGASGTLTLRGTSGREYESDFQLMATGFVRRTEYLEPLEAELGTSLRDERGGILIRPTFQLDTDRLPTVFALGDACALPRGSQYAYIVSEQAKVAAANVATMIRAGGQVPSGTLQMWSGQTANAILVPIGPQLGVMQAMGIVLGKSALGNVAVRNLKSKDYFLGKTSALFAAGANTQD
ncbi:hypothetical protein H4R19_002689 [Coemansia spiralis]|nr:hypothetical protein H4R19_002689 [Coemansia spiralis]